jgi:hypothetical protein
MARSNNHFISVSKRGELVARRKGSAPRVVATVAEGIVVQSDEAARLQGAPPEVRVHFLGGGAHRELRVLTIEGLDVAEFQAKFGVSDEALGRWLREAVERALD